MNSPKNMTNKKPTTPGWYWYELAGSWPIQPVLVFDSGPDGLMYTLESISVGESDDERDGFFLDDAAPDALWSTAPIPFGSIQQDFGYMPVWIGYDLAQVKAGEQ